MQSDFKKAQYLFESKGEQIIIKAIEYSPVSQIDDRIVYNLGFGDFDEKTGGIIDNANSNNGDMRRVFSTVLNTIPEFFKKNENSAIWVAGSDSSEDYINQCNCKKNCRAGICKNRDRRIRTYRYYIDKNFKELSKEYTFFGFRNEEFVKYFPRNDYSMVLVYKKTNN